MRCFVIVAERFVALLLVGACHLGAPSDLDQDPLPTVPPGDDVGNPSPLPRQSYTYIMDALAILSPSEGHALGQDRTPDNALGVLSESFRPGMAESIAAGWTTMLWSVTLATDPLAPPRGDAALHIYWALDADDPSVPENNLTSAGLFRILSPDFGVSCRASAGVQTTRLWECNPATWQTLGLADLRIAFVLSEDGARVTARATGVYTLCGLATTLFPGTRGGTLLDALGSTASADIDRDGDGLERIEDARTPFARCLDGDGTVIAGPHCACDSRVADGYSVAFRASAITAAIVPEGASSDLP